MVFHVPIMLAVRVGKLVVGKVDDAVSDPNDAEYQARKRGEKQDGKLRKILVNAAKKGVNAVSGDGCRGTPDSSGADLEERWAAAVAEEEEAELQAGGRAVTRTGRRADRANRRAVA